MVNEDPNARIIRELRAEVDALKEMLKHATDMVKIKTFYIFLHHTAITNLKLSSNKSFQFHTYFDFDN